MFNSYKDLSFSIVDQVWSLMVKDSWSINHDQHKEVLGSNLYDILLKNIPEIEMLSFSSSELKESIFHRNLVDIAQIMELSSRDELVSAMSSELDMALKVIHSLIIKDNADDATVLLSKINDASRYNNVLSPVTNFQAKAKKINTLVTKIMSIIQHTENSKELGIQTSNPSFGQVFSKMASNPRFNEELSLYLKSLSN